ncbi:NF038104 family lipoprotein [Zoogloea sp.]|uniref:NF038104 family lipoprotein n=1 Tax=Zoogloea sp. TaxID=49181 RepID=UPI0026216FF8|nr:NF038104 family lipoprotein [Zoogloea sp.]MDD3354194.1 NF038104 family lipoprotein [Zoogloea sp.]
MIARYMKRAGLLMACLLGLSGCVVGAVVGTAVDVGVEVVKVPFKVGKGIYDAVSDDEDDKKK